MKQKILAAALSLVCLLGLASCGSQPASEPYQLTATIDMVKAGAFSEDLEELDADTAFALYKLADEGINREDLMDASILRSSGATCEEAAVLMFSNSGKAESAKTALDAYVQSQIESNADYRPDEIPKLENALVAQADSTVILVVANDLDAAKGVL